MAVYDTLSDVELTELLRLDDKRAFSCIYDRYWKLLFRAGINRLNDRGRAQDIVQNVFTSLWDRRTEVRIENLSAYLHTAVKFQVLRLFSQSGRTQFLASFEELITQPVESNNPIEEREILRLLQLFIDALPQKRRAIFIKRYQENYTTAEIADELGISKKTVLNQLNNAETALRIRLTHLLTVSIVVAFFLKK
jgi:RNA polymerase sigma factor (sigma-70 family)